MIQFDLDRVELRCEQHAEDMSELLVEVRRLKVRCRDLEERARLAGEAERAAHDRVRRLEEQLATLAGLS